MVRRFFIFLVILVILVPGIVLAQSGFNPLSFFTWLLGAVWQQPKVFENAQGAYFVQKMKVPPELVSIFGPTIIVDPSSRLGTMSQAGVKMITIGDFNWTTEADVEFHKNRDAKVESAVVEISFAPHNKSSGNVTPKLILWREQFNNVNGSEIRIYPPRSVDSNVQDEWNRVVENSKLTGEIIILTVDVYVLSPVKLKASQSFQVFVYPAMSLAKAMGYMKSGDGLGVALQSAEKQDRQRQREESGKTIKILVKSSNSSMATANRPVGLVIYDSLGEVHRGDVSDGQTFKVLPESKSNTIRVTQMENEVPLGMIPATPMDPKSQRQIGYVSIVEGSEIMVYPIENFRNISGVCEPRIIKGEVKIYASKGSQIPISVAAEGEQNSKGTIIVDRFGGKIVPVWSDKPQSEMIITAYTKNGSYTQKLTPTTNQVIFDLDTKSSVRSYSTINTNPAVRGGINSKEQFIKYAQTSHFIANINATGVDPKELQIFRQHAQAGKIGYTIVGPEVRRFADNGSWITSTNLIKSLTECGPNGQPIGHQTFYQTTFKSWHRVWVPIGRYGWVPGIISTCGNAVMVYIPPPVAITPPKKIPPVLALAPPPDVPMKVSWNDLTQSVASVNQQTTVVTPSSISSYVPQAYIDIDNTNSQSQSQDQHQNQHQGQWQDQNSTNINNNTNNNSNINTNNIDVNNTNINQNMQILNNANAVNGGR